ncbi:hypothetical protein KM043_014298 [Ampulex compressa]|nr:hypothetical protein KM043_014298 [Ampulex compressa]
MGDPVDNGTSKIDRYGSVAKRTGTVSKITTEETALSGGTKIFPGTDHPGREYSNLATVEFLRHGFTRRGRKVSRVQDVVGAGNHLINTSAAEARLPFRVDCIANKTQIDISSLSAVSTSNKTPMSQVMTVVDVEKSRVLNYSNARIALEDTLLLPTAVLHEYFDKAVLSQHRTT